MKLSELQHPLIYNKIFTQALPKLPLVHLIWILGCFFSLFNCLFYLSIKLEYNMIFIKTLVSFLNDPEYRDLIFTTIFILFLGMMSYHYLEGWDYVDSLYFSIITLTTIGYGDFSPETTEGKLFTIFYIILGVGMILAFINTVYNHYEKERTRVKK